MVELKAIYTIWLREVIKYSRSIPRIIGSLTMPFIFLAILGVGLNSAFTVQGGGNYLSFLSPGIIGMSLMFTSVFAGISVIFDRQFGFLKEILVAPVSRTSIALGKILGSATISLITALVILIVAVLMGGISPSQLNVTSILTTILFMLLIAIIFVSIGLIIASVLNDTEGFQMIVNLFVMPLFFLSGAFFPIDTAPDWMQALAHIDPLYYGVDGMRAALIGTSANPVMFDATVLVVLAAALVMISSYMFSKMQK